MGARKYRLFAAVILVSACLLLVTATLASAVTAATSASSASPATTTSASATTTSASHRTVRVGCDDLKSFITQNPDGTYSGYAADYLDEISYYTGWDFQITVADDDSLKSMLDDGELDFLMPVEYSESGESTFTYTDYPIGEQINGLYVLDTCDDVYYDDYEAFDGMSIGAVKDTYPATSLQTFAEAHGFSYKEVLYPDLASLCDGLESGEVDAVCRSGLGNIPDDYRLVAATELIPFYIVAPAGRDGMLFLRLNSAINSINADQPALASELHDKYLRDQDPDAQVNFTKEETAYIASHPVINIAGFSDRYPVCYLDPSTGKMEGILKDLLDQVAQETGLTFNYTTGPANTPIVDSLDDPNVDLIVGAIRSKDYRENQDIRLSSGLMENLTGIVGPKDQSFDVSREYTVALPASSTGTIGHVREYHPGYTIITYSSTEECLRAVMEGKADAAMQNADVLAAILQHPEYSSLSLWYTFTEEGEYDYCVASCSETDPLLISIINKGINALDPSDVQATQIEYTSATRYQTSLQDFFAEYGTALATAGVLLFFILAIIAYAYQTKQKDLVKVQRAMDQTQRAMEKTQQAMVEAREAMEESQRANEAKSDFLSRMSHDMRTPLNGILGMTYLMQKMSLPENAQEDLRKIDTSSRFLLGLINDILDMAKAESGKLELHPEPYPIDELHDYLDAVIRPLCVERNLGFVFERRNPTSLGPAQNPTSFGPAQNPTNLGPAEDPGDLVPIVDKLRMNQILFNLLSNSVKFTPEGGTVECHVACRPLVDERVAVRIVVSDDGIGMDDRFMEHLFEPFVQEGRDDTSCTRGSGFGLAIVKKLVDLMGGTVEVASQRGEGTVFTLDFEFDSVRQESLDIVPATPDEDVSWDLLAGKHVLLCEDHPLNQEIAKTILEERQMAVELAENGQRGVEAFRMSGTGFYDVILMDIRMPVMDGYEATRQIRALDRPDARTIPIIAMTADAFQDDIQKCVEAGMDAHVAKPVEPDVLFRRIGEVLGGGR